ncbi:RmlC-like cupin domain-containing protein [Lineolata rhizophorae]|uniref:RmlC-like cupin domain-containing protein n=1 Tax=Lineolata rhizophorae TaxID=578093 RepID=A0A6A6P847_9PEZI|nr:RmlC-like cupin domain-containing protein [Lineolata rhizophorae]
MPRPRGDGRPTVGVQLWVDLPAHLKLCEPRYRDLRAGEIPLAESPDGRVAVKVISGLAYGVESPKELAYTPVWLLDVTVRPGGKFVQNVPAGWNAFAYMIEGAARLGEGDKAKLVDEFHIAVFHQDGDTVVAEVPEVCDKDGKEAGARFLLVAGMPLDQKIVQYGPFVMTSQEEVYQAVMDFQMGANGFERARTWESEIGKRMNM